MKLELSAACIYIFLCRDTMYFFIPTDFTVLESVDSAEVMKSPAHAKLSDQGDLLRHVSHTRSRDSGARPAWLSSQNPYASRVDILNSYDAG